MTNIAIVEDDSSDRDKLKTYLDRYAQSQGENFRITEFPNGSLILKEDTAKYDLILLDIEMPGLDGITTAEKIRETNSASILIFITNITSYVLKGYEVDALDYVLKPLQYEAFVLRLDKVMQKVRRKQHSFIMLPLKKGMKRLDTDHLIYIEARDHTITCHLDREEISLRGSLKIMEEKLKGRPFSRPSKAFLANLDRVENVNAADITVSGIRLPLSRTRKKAFMKDLAEFMAEL